MKFRLKAFSLHLLGSASALTLILGTLYFGWYRWPGWRLADAAQVVAVLIGVDLVVGPLITLVIASNSKARHVLSRDIEITSSPPVIVPVTIFWLSCGSSGSGAQIQRGVLYQCGASPGFFWRPSSASAASMS